MKKITFAGFKINLPSHPIVRMVLGVALCIGGILGFLPVLGFWMVPLGLLVLSVDMPMVRRFRRVATVKLGHFLQKKWPNLARRFGFGVPRTEKI